MTAASHHRGLRILQVAPGVQGGGGEQIALRLHREFLARGHDSMLAVGRGLPEGEGVFSIPNRWDATLWTRLLRTIHRRLRILSGGKGERYLSPFFEVSAFPSVPWDLARGVEDFHQPGSHRLLDLAPVFPDIVILHNLHARWNRREGFFDLRYLPALTRKVPAILFPQDPWLLTGHCAHPLDCPRWRIGCGQCPDLEIYPSIRRDATAFNFRRKRSIFSNSRLYLAAPSQWLAGMFAEADIPLAGSRVFPNGVDTQIFKPGDRQRAREAVGLEPGRRVVLVSGNYLRKNPWKGYVWIPAAMEKLAAKPGIPPVDILCVGDEGEPIHFGCHRILFAGRIQDSCGMPEYYRAADAFFHPSRADTAPFSIVEAMSSGLPVLATNVGGIPEQVEDGRTGFLVPAGDTDAMAEKLALLLTDGALSEAMGKAARRRAQAGFDFFRQAAALLDWMTEILEKKS